MEWSRGICLSCHTFLMTNFLKIPNVVKKHDQCHNLMTIFRISLIYLFIYYVEIRCHSLTPFHPLNIWTQHHSPTNPCQHDATFSWFLAITRRRSKISGINIKLSFVNPYLNPEINKTLKLIDTQRQEARTFFDHFLEKSTKKKGRQRDLRTMIRNDVCW